MSCSKCVHVGMYSPAEFWRKHTGPCMLKNWVAVKELNLSYHIVDIWQLIGLIGFLDYGKMS